MVELSLLIGASLAFAFGGVAMKYSAGLTRIVPSVLIFVLFGAGAVLQALGMRTAAMGNAYIAVLGLETVIAFGLGVLVFGEPVSAQRILAVSLALVAIALLRA